MRSVQPKDPRLLMPKFLALAKGQPCSLNTAVCNHDDATTIAAHSEQYKHGHSGGKKAHDIFVIYACSDCHDWLDGRHNAFVPKSVRSQHFDDRWPDFILWCVREGILKCGTR